MNIVIDDNNLSLSPTTPLPKTPLNIIQRSIKANLANVLDFSKET
jgi:hypothetical protein